MYFRVHVLFFVVIDVDAIKVVAKRVPLVYLPRFVENEPSAEAQHNMFSINFQVVDIIMAVKIAG
jgi:hypothetical protein